MNRPVLVLAGLATLSVAHGQANTIGFIRDIAVPVSDIRVATMPSGNFCVAIQSGTTVKVYIINRINQVVGSSNFLGPSAGVFKLGALSVGADNSLYISTSYQDDVMVYRTNSTGGLLWTKRVNGGSSSGFVDSPLGHTFDNSGNLIVVGAFERDGTKPGGFCFGLRPTNAGLFVRTQTEAEAEAVAVGADGTIHVACSGENTGRYWKLTSAGVTSLLAPLGTDERGFAIAVNPVGQVFIAGDAKTGSDRAAFFTRRNSANGAFVWGILNGADGSRFRHIAIDGSGNVYAGGSMRYPEASGSSYIKVDPISGGVYYSRSRLGSGADPYSGYGGFWLDAYNEQYMVIDHRGATGTTEIFKASNTGVLRWNAFGGGTDESDAVGTFHNPSGDMFLASERGGNLRINCVRQAPLAVADSFSTPRNTAITTRNVKSNDRFAVDASPSLVTGAAHGTVVVNPNGTFVYTPTSGYTGPDSFTYRLTRSGLNTSNAIVSITVTP